MGTVTLLLDHGAEVEATNSATHTALLLAAHFGHSAMVRLLLDRGAVYGIKTAGSH